MSNKNRKNREDGLCQKRRGASLTGYGLIVGLVAIAAIAAISGVGQEVRTLFSDVAQAMQGTDGESGGGGGEEEEEEEGTCPPSPVAPGDLGCTAADGAFFAGNSGGNDIFIAPTDEANTDLGFLAWGPTGATGLNAMGTNLTDGLVNTNTLMSLSGTYPAAQACADKSLGGANWYLPAREELRDVWFNLVDTDDDNNLSPAEQSAAEAAYGFDFVGDNGTGRYWSSSEHSNNNNARSVRFDINSHIFINKGTGISVRCMRR